jgi:hypothetical protein
MLGVKQEFQHLPLGAPLYWKTWERGLALGVREAEASLILETNTRMRRTLERMGATIYKTYRNYHIPLATSSHADGIADARGDTRLMASPDHYPG